MGKGVVKENLQKALDLLECSMLFDKTPQGYEYWDGVRKNMEQLIEAATDKPKPIEAWCVTFTAGHRQFFNTKSEADYCMKVWKLEGEPRHLIEAEDRGW